MAKRGRPPKHDFALLDEMIKNQPPSYIVKLRQAGIGSGDINQEMIDSCKQIIEEYRKGFGLGRFIPINIFMAIADIEDNSFTTEEKAAIEATKEAKELRKKYREAIAKGKKYQAEATRGAKQKPLDRAEEVWFKKENEDLRADIKQNSRKLNEATKKIVDEWDKRGDLDKKPTPRTLRKWYNELF